MSCDYVKVKCNKPYVLKAPRRHGEDCQSSCSSSCIPYEALKGDKREPVKCTKPCFLKYYGPEPESSCSSSSSSCANCGGCANGCGQCRSCSDFKSKSELIRGLKDDKCSSSSSSSSSERLPRTRVCVDKNKICKPHPTAVVIPVVDKCEKVTYDANIRTFTVTFGTSNYHPYYSAQGTYQVIKVNDNVAPRIYLTRGKTYQFNVDTGNPNAMFYLSNSPISNGNAGNGMAGLTPMYQGTAQITVDKSFPDHFYYHVTNQPSAGNIIIVTDK